MQRRPHSRAPRRHPAATLVAVLTLALVAPAIAGADPTGDAKSSFDRFAAKWIGDQNRMAAKDANPTVKLAAAGGGRPIRYTRFSEEFVTGIKETGDKTVPYVGVLHYTELRYECSGANGKDCALVRTSPITEFFPYQNGRWVY
jgi:hypothetical protein